LKTLLLLDARLLSALLVLSRPMLAQISARPGIILLLLLNSILSSKAESAGQVVTARLVQNNPLAEGFTSKPGNTIVGHTIELNATADVTGATTAYRFDESRLTKSICSSPYAQDLFIPLKCRSCSGFPIPSGRVHSPRDRDQSPHRGLAQGPSRKIYSAGFLAITPTA
jgi:hypothetical protein